MQWSDAPGFLSLLIAIGATYFTYRASRSEHQNTQRRDAVEGFDKLADDLRTDLGACKEELRSIKVTLTTIERANHELTYRNDALERERDDLIRENEALRRQLGA